MIQTKWPSGENVFFTSDTHFGHQNILQYAQRPFKTIKEMDETLIANWNQTVPDNATVYHLGDFCFGDAENVARIVEQLNGNIVLIKGNHDRNIDQRCIHLFQEVYDQHSLLIEGQRILLNHYPILCYAGTYSSSKPTWQLFGHLHLKAGGSGADFNRVSVCFPYQYDVGVDLNNYAPISWQQLRERILFQIQNNTNITYWLKHPNTEKD
ncbi:MAG: metallophosphoesterase [Paludibacteraceae bacterium]|nr:metallophosphoesterase [Paludibacteraceae bacterium]